MRRRIYLAGIAALSMAAAATGEPLDGLEFLVGTWSSGASDFQGTDVFQLDLDGRILQRHSRSTVLERTFSARLHSLAQRQLV